MRLWVRLTIIIALVTIVPLVLVGLSAANISFEGSRATFDEASAREAESQAEFVGRWLQDQVQALEGWMTPFELQGNPALVEGLARAVFVANSSVQTVVVVDPDGLSVSEVFLTAPDGSGRDVGSARRAQELIDRLPLSQVAAQVRLIQADELVEVQEDLVSQGVDPDRVDAWASGQVGPDDVLDRDGRPLPGWAFLQVVVPPPNRAVAGEAYLPQGASAPAVAVAAGDTDSTLVLGAELSLGFLDELLAAEPGHGVALLDSSGTAIVGGEHPLIDATTLKPLLQTQASFSQVIGGERVYGGVAPVPNTDWTVVVVTPARLVEAPALKIRGRMLQVLVFSILLAALVGAGVARTVSQPVAALRDAALRVADGSFGHQTPVRRGDELGDLTQAFNHMSRRLEHNQAQIEAQREEIEAFNAELQDRVDARTRELQSAQQQLVKSGQLAAVAEVGAGLAHELNNPLAGILGTAQLLRARSEGDEDELLASIEEQAERCREVVHAMLRFASGEVDPQQQPVIDLQDVLRDVAQLVRGPFRQRGVELTLQESDERLLVRLDPVHGTRIFAQILNTLRAGLREGTALAMVPGRDGDRVRVELEADQAVASHDDWMASGMGLWVAHRLLHQLGGELVDPTGEGRRWYVFLPAEAR